MIYTLDLASLILILGAPMSCGTTAGDALQPPLGTPVFGGYQSVKERNYDPYSSLDKNIFNAPSIFDVPIHFADKMFLFFDVYRRLELVLNPDNNSILSQPIFWLPQKFQERNKYTGDETGNPLVD